jgi:D-glycero-D-manno-heptose 1,7-bisphosphate phosphatase
MREMSKKILFCDIDDTLTQTISGHTFKKHPNDVKVFESASKSLRYFAALDFTIVGISNQAGVSKGYKTLEEAVKEMTYTISLIPDLSLIKFCPDFEGEQCCTVWKDEYNFTINPKFKGLYRKPHNGMIESVLCAFDDINRSECLMTGDRAEDKMAADASRIPFIWAQDWRTKYGNFK